MTRSLLVFLATFCAAPAALAQTTEVVERAEPLEDAGFRFHVAVGYPAIASVGVGWKVGRTEVLAQAGGVALWAFLVGTAELSASYDLTRGAIGTVHGGVGASVLHSHGFVIDCYEGESCEDWIQTLWLVSPRLGGRLRLDRRKPHGTLPYLELVAGPQVGLCRGSCPDGDVVVNATVTLRGLLDFRRRPGN